MMTSYVFIHRLSRFSYSFSSLPTAISRRKTEEIIELDNRDKRERYASVNRAESGRKSQGSSGKARWSFGSSAMLVSISKLNTMEYRKVRVTGEFLHEREFYISPRGRFDPGHAEQRSGSIFSQDNLSSHGGHIITPFRLSNSNLIVLINRGWVPASMISPASRQSSQPKGIVTFDAVVRKSETRPQFVSGNVPEKGQWYYKDFYEMARYHNTDPIYLEAVYESTVDGGPIGGQTNVSVRNDHLSYLLTWLVLLARKGLSTLGSS
ncbi:Surfeit locus protein 1 [Parelaphostrongylus tenuis]|uniref:SURF1-like protein n=1 Tax=Parelaphostrongylus tenuis TaxID=148309 RepID=A0AAD5QG99_PARTN|nr:Surfeit locus protein 1 [Parelaphostrongylus tenuis]